MTTKPGRRTPAPFQGTYPTFEAAEQRVELLRDFGIWPGIVGQTSPYTLTHDITLTIAEMKSRGWR